MARVKQLKIKDSVYQLEDWRINSITEEPIVDSTDPISSGAVAALKEEIGEHFNAIESDTENLHNDLESKVDKVEGKALSTEDYSTEEKDKLASIESGANVNLIEKIVVNSTELPINNKKVNITVPVKLVDLGDDTYHRTVSDSEKETWNNKQDAISDLEEIRSNAAEGASKISNVQADWNAIDGLATILNKPEIPSIEGLASEQFVSDSIAESLISTEQRIQELEDSRAIISLEDDTLVIE